MFGSLVLLGIGMFLATSLHADTPRPVMWAWMILAGLGIGPSFAVFTLIVQNAVSPDRIGVATSSLTFFQQIGGTVGLTVAGTLFGDRLGTEIPAQLARAGVPPQFMTQLAGGGGALDLTGTGDLGARILATVPAGLQASVAPMIPGIVSGIHEAISIAIASTFWVGIGGALIAAAFVLLLREEPMRTTFDFEAATPEEVVA